MITKEQEEEFKRRKAAGPIVPLELIEEFNKSRVEFTQAQYQEFLASTDSKCNGDS